MQYLLYVSYRRSTWLLTSGLAPLHGLRLPWEKSIRLCTSRFYLVTNAHAWNKRVDSEPGPVYVQGCKKQGKSRWWILPVIWCLSWFSSGLCPYPISLHHCVRGSIQKAPYICPWELLYADDLMISAESMSIEELLVMLKTLKSEIAKKGWFVNEHGEDKDYGGWLGFGFVKEIWKGSLRRLSERSR